MHDRVPTIICHWRGGIVLFNDALNTFYLQLFMVKGHLESAEKETTTATSRCCLGFLLLFF